MAIIEHDLSKHAQILGKPEDYFVDEHDHVWRVVEHKTGEVKFILRPDGQLAHYRQGPNPSAPPITGTFNAHLDRASVQGASQARPPSPAARPTPAPTQAPAGGTPHPSP